MPPAVGDLGRSGLVCVEGGTLAPDGTLSFSLGLCICSYLLVLFLDAYSSFVFSLGSETGGAATGFLTCFRGDLVTVDYSFISSLPSMYS
jgi:hypothetical protein